MYHHTSLMHDCNVKHTNQLCDNYSFNIKIQSPNAAFRWNGYQERTFQQNFPAINTTHERLTGVATLLFQDTKPLDMKTVHISTKKNKYLLILLEEVIEL
jgi:hypothetical protein